MYNILWCLGHKLGFHEHEHLLCVVLSELAHALGVSCWGVGTQA